MRLTALFLFIVSLHVSAHTYSQTVSFKGKNVPLETVFASFEKQTGLSFFFNYALIKDIKPVTVDVRDMPLDDALSIILKEQGLSYYKTGKTIFIVAAVAHSPGMSKGVSDEMPTIAKGRVVNSQGEPLVGASVEVKNGKKATLTNEKGMYELKNVDPGTTLVISYTGYQKEEVVANGSGEAQTIVLRIANNSLDQAQVIAYGTTTQRLNTGNVTTISGADIQKQPVDNPLEALEGRVPGMVITQSTGLPGSGVTVRIQGQNSIQFGNDPLYVIDGVPYTSQMLPNGAGILGGSGGPVINGVAPGNGSPMSYINPGDIESISVLKDADATAIYGSRAANGAVLITTKKGKPGKTAVNFNLQNGWGHVGHYLPVLNTPEYLIMRHEAFANDGVTPAPTDYDINGFWDSTRNINWQRVLIGSTEAYSNYDMTISGGTANTQFLFGTTYHRQTTVFPGDFRDQKGSVHVSITNTSENKKFRLNLSVSYLADDNELPGSDLTASSNELAPDAPKLYNADGGLNWMPTSSGTSSFSGNPLASNYNTYSNKINNLISNASASYRLLPNLDLSANVGYTNLAQNETSLYPLIAWPPEERAYVSRVAAYTHNTIASWIIEPQLSYKRSFGRSAFTGLLGTTIEQNNSYAEQLVGTGYSSDNILTSIAAASILTGTNMPAVYKYNAGFARFNYVYANKYIIDLVGRRDGSSRFGTDNEFHDFGSMSAGWIFTEEPFMKNLLPVLSFGKLRASYGTTGSDQIGDYQYLNTYSSSSYTYQGTVGIHSNGLPNPYLQWEETKKLQFGIDLGLVNNRIVINSSYFQNRSSNELLPYNLPIITGFGSINDNFPATVQNTGTEITINSKNINHKDFSWSTSLNLTIPRNKLVSFPNLASSSYAGNLVVGKPIISMMVYHYVGVNDSTGQYQFASSQGTPTYSPDYNTDRTVLISTAPKIYGGLENSFKYRTFQLDFMFQVTSQIGSDYIFNPAPGFFNNGYSNQPTDVLNRWQKVGDKTNMQQFTQSNYNITTGCYNALLSDLVYKSASYIRLKNLSLSWQLPSNTLKQIHLSDAKIYVLAQNVFTVTHYKGLDPETLSSSTLPPLRVITAGIQIGL